MRFLSALSRRSKLPLKTDETRERRYYQMTKRVVVTGLGIISPVGIGKDSFWKSLLEGKNGIGKITLFDAAEYSAQIAGEVTDFEPTDYLDRKDARHMDRYAQFAVVAPLAGNIPIFYSLRSATYLRNTAMAGTVFPPMSPHLG